MNIKEKGFRDETFELIKGTYDLHTHTNPSHFDRDLNDFELMEECNEYGMAGAIIKSHYEPTGARAKLVNLRSGVDTKAYGMVALNWPVGGLNPYAVESALNMGASLVWLPTRDATNSLVYGDMPGDFYKRPGISIVDDNGKLKEEVYNIMEIARKYDCYVSTGHVSAHEAVLYCEEAVKMYTKTILTHPDWTRTVIPVDKQAELARQGVLIEKVWLNVAEGMITMGELADHVKLIGSENIFMVTDRGQKGCERPAVAMMNFIEGMVDEKVSHEEIRNMTTKVPGMILNV